MASRSSTRARVAQRPTAAPTAAPALQRKTAAPVQADDPARAADRARQGHRFEAVAPAPLPNVPVAAPGSGRPIPPPVREQMESALGADFAGVRLHEGP